MPIVAEQTDYYVEEKNLMKSVIGNKTISLLSFDADGSRSSYKLKQLEQPIIDKLKTTIEKLERLPQVYLCVRGDCFLNLECHDTYIEQDLAKLFIVGEKAKYHLRDGSGRSIEYYRKQTEVARNIKDEIRSLVEECNEIIRNKPASHGIQGQIPEECLNFILSQSQTDLEGWQIFFLSFLHNNGKPRNFKRSSPFISLTYGCKKLATARRFALSQSPYGKGIIFLYSLNSNWPYYIRAKDLTEQLKDYGVQWYKDIHREILLINGMYPHFLVGLFEVSIKRTLKFILNPWIYKQFKHDCEFNYTEGVDINQVRFKDFAQSLGYQGYFCHESGKQIEYVSDFNTSKINRVFRV